MWHWSARSTVSMPGGQTDAGDAVLRCSAAKEVLQVTKQKTALLPHTQGRQILGCNVAMAKYEDRKNKLCCIHCM